MNTQRLFPVASLACLSLLAASFAAAQQLPSAITTDPAADKQFPAGTEAPDVMSHGSRMNAVMYVTSGADPHPTVLIMHGFPGNEKNLDLAYVLRRAGWNVLIPHYRGAWGSSGAFSFSNAMEDTLAAIQFLRDPANDKKYRIDPKKIVLIGHSMGGFMVAYGGAREPAVAGVIMISAWNIAPNISQRPEKETLDEFKSASPRLAGSTPDGLLAESKQNAAKMNFLTFAPELSTRPVLVLESDDGLIPDDHAMAEALRQAGDSRVTETHMETGHGYDDHRIALQVAILNWLQQVANNAQ